MIGLPITRSIIALGVVLAVASAFGRSPKATSRSTTNAQGVPQADTPWHHLIGEWELLENAVGTGVKLRFDPVNVHMDTLLYPYSIDGDTLRIFTRYKDHIGDGNSHGFVAKLTDDSLVVHWREGDVNTYRRPR